MNDLHRVVRLSGCFTPSSLQGLEAYLIGYLLQVPKFLACIIPTGGL